MATGANATEVGIVACRADTVAEEDVEHVVLGVYPETSACEARVPIGFRRCLGASVAGIGIAHYGFVESQTTVAIGTLLGCENLNCRRLVEPNPTVSSTIKPHLQQFGKVVTC